MRHPRRARDSHTLGRRITYYFYSSFSNCSLTAGELLGRHTWRSTFALSYRTHHFEQDCIHLVCELNQQVWHPKEPSQPAADSRLPSSQNIGIDPWLDSPPAFVRHCERQPPQFLADVHRSISRVAASVPQSGENSSHDYDPLAMNCLRFPPLFFNPCKFKWLCNRFSEQTWKFALTTMCRSHLRTCG